jgi:ferredoxin
MAYKITEECINCGACEPECPNQSISAGDTIYIIDSNKCTECVGYCDESHGDEGPAHRQVQRPQGLIFSTVQGIGVSFSLLFFYGLHG